MGGNMRRLRPGGISPDFQAEIWDGRAFELKSMRGKKIWLAFFRYASCPLCNLRVHEMIQKHETLKKLGVEVVTVFQSPKESIAEYVGTQKPPFPLISDPDEKLYRLYGLEASKLAFLHPGNLPLLLKAFGLGFKMGRREGTITRIPADFLINPDGSLHTVFYGDKIGDHIPIDLVTRFAEEGAGN